jgi:hypothetical protein
MRSQTPCTWSTRGLPSRSRGGGGLVHRWWWCSTVAAVLSTQAGRVSYSWSVRWSRLVLVVEQHCPRRPDSRRLKPAVCSGDFNAAAPPTSYHLPPTSYLLAFPCPPVQSYGRRSSSCCCRQGNQRWQIGKQEHREQPQMEEEEEEEEEELVLYYMY